MPEELDTALEAALEAALQIALIRHGQSTANATGVWQGQLDFPLSDKGRAQARLAGQAISAAPPEAIYASPLLRAYETAQLIAEGSGLEGGVVTLPGLQERRGGLLEGTTAREREERYPDLMRKFSSLEESDRWALVDAETDEEVLGRFMEAIGEIVARHEPGSRISIVSHGGAMRAFLREFFGPEILAGSQRAENASITRFVWPWSGTPRLLDLGSTAHLDPLQELPGA
ncbi:MAG: histidine phosphatase family protein [Rubrobacteraceae bacterium]